jgi:membrane associated rhomboid family serine protease
MIKVRLAPIGPRSWTSHNAPTPAGRRERNRISRNRRKHRLCRLSSQSHEPVLGASGAVAGVLAASLLCNPNGIVWLPGLPIFLRVWMFAPLWFISELLNAINEQYVRSTLGGVAYLVHVGGFIFGLVAATTFTRADRLGKDQGP